MERFLRHGRSVRPTSVEAVRRLGQSVHTGQPTVADVLRRDHQEFQASADKDFHPKVLPTPDIGSNSVDR